MGWDTPTVGRQLICVRQARPQFVIPAQLAQWQSDKIWTIYDNMLELQFTTDTSPDDGWDGDGPTQNGSVQSNIFIMKIFSGTSDN